MELSLLLNYQKLTDSLLIRKFCGELEPQGCDNDINIVICNFIVYFRITYSSIHYMVSRVAGYNCDCNQTVKTYLSHFFATN